MATYYTILGVPEHATSDTIKRAYKKAAVKYHPDKNPGNRFAEERFKQINEAYSVLSDSGSRAAYDQKLYYARFPRTHFSTQPNTKSESGTSSTSTRKTAPKKKPRDFSRSRKQNNAYLWVLGFFTFTYFLFTVISSYYDDRKTEKVIASMAAAEKKKHEIEWAIDSGNYWRAMTLFNDLPDGEQADLFELKESIVQEMEMQSKVFLVGNQYEKSLKLLKALENFTDKLENNHYVKLGLCYKGLGELEMAIESFKKDVTIYEDHLLSYTEAAGIYLYDLKNYDSAMALYDRATERIISNYRRIYGDAYLVLVTSKNSTSAEYENYLGRAIIFLRRKEYKKALNSTIWAVRVNEKGYRAMQIRGDCLVKLSENSKACKWYQKAEAGGNVLAAERLKEFCY